MYGLRRRLAVRRLPWPIPAYNSWRILFVERVTSKINSLLKYTFLATINTLYLSFFFGLGEGEAGTFAEATFVERMTPLWSYSSFVARGASALVAVVMVTSARAQRELIASPLNPKVSSSSKFSNDDSFEV